MPLFGNKGARGKQRTTPKRTIKNSIQMNNQVSAGVTPKNGKSGMNSTASCEDTPPKLIFHCQEAQGSETGLISDFSNVQELYQKIGECFNFPADEILFCTLNTHRIDMENLLSSQLRFDDFIFVHRKGTKKEVEVRKTEEALGLTITDNGTGYAFVKRIKKGSIVDAIPVLQIGDHIEAINGHSLIGKRHVEVAKVLKDIPTGDTFVIRLIEPLKSGFLNISSKSDSKKSRSYGSGTETLRFRANGPARIERAPDDATQVAIKKVNDLLETYMGINDSDLARQIWEMSDGLQNTMELAEVMDNSELDLFGFTDDFIIEVWGIVTDARAGRLNRMNSTENTENVLENFQRLKSK